MKETEQFIRHENKLAQAYLLANGHLHTCFGVPGHSGLEVKTAFCMHHIRNLTEAGCGLPRLVLRGQILTSFVHSQEVRGKKKTAFSLLISTAKAVSALP